MKHETKALLPVEDDDIEETTASPTTRGYDRGLQVWWRQNKLTVIYGLVLHAFCFALLAKLLVSSLLSRPNKSLQVPHFVPKEFELQPEYVSGHNDHSQFSGLPNENNTRAWDDLIKPTFFMATQELLEETGETVDDATRLAAGGYLAGLGVYHEIHCLRRLRLYLFADYYYEPLTEANLKYLRGHLGHCIEALRRSVLCNADTTLYTFGWDNSSALRPEPKSNQNRVCTKWSSVTEWINQRNVPLNPWLIRPSGAEDQVHMKRDLTNKVRSGEPTLRKRGLGDHDGIFEF